MERATSVSDQTYCFRDLKTYEIAVIIAIMIDYSRGAKPFIQKSHIVSTLRQGSQERFGRFGGLYVKNPNKEGVRFFRLDPQKHVSTL